MKNVSIETELEKLRNLVDLINKLIKEGFIFFDNHGEILQNEYFTFENGELLLTNGRGGSLYLLPKGDCTIYGCSSYLHEVQKAIKSLRSFKYINKKDIKTFRNYEQL